MAPSSSNAACPRRNIANQDSWLTIRCGHPLGHPSSTVKYTVASGLFRQIEDKTKVAADERAPSRLPPSSPPPSHYCGALNLIHDGSAMLSQARSSRAFTVSTNCLVHPSAAFLKRVQIAMSLNATWHGWWLHCREFALWDFHEQENTLVSVTRVECHANKYLVCSSSPIQLRLHALCPFHMILSTMSHQKVCIAYLGLFLPIDSVYQVIVRFVYMIQLLNPDQPIPLPESYLWLSMQPFKYLQVA
ncbi:unnamed protein product [Penicillium salamii]|nr:unnamed protein product [Penicillium salamii]CAG8666713.1 unnamed protein product [Penicillium salamii]CAG8890225.1 unnamed protein product [Penicillium salamii]